MNLTKNELVNVQGGCIFISLTNFFKSVVYGFLKSVRW